MDEQRRQAYLKLIDQMLTCESGQEPEVLQQHQELVDENFLQVARFQVNELNLNGQEKAAAYLKVIIQQLEFVIAPEYQDKIRAYLILTQALLVCPNWKEGQRILQANNSLVDSYFIEVIKYVSKECEQYSNADARKLMSFAHYMHIVNGAQYLPKYFNLIFEAFKIIEFSNDDEEKMLRETFTLLAKHQDILDLNLVATFKVLGAINLQNIERRKQEALANCFANFIQHLRYYLRLFLRSNSEIGNEISIIGYQFWLKVFNGTLFLQQLAYTNQNLGFAYWNRKAGDIKKNLELSIESYQSALGIYTKDNSPWEWAEVQYLLGGTYRNRIAGDRQEKIKVSIAAFKLALEVYTKANSPQMWPEVQYCLGTSYLFRKVEAEEENIELSINAFESALKAHNTANLPHWWVDANYKLGISYFKRKVGVKEQNLERSIKFLEAALESYPKAGFPYRYAEIQNFLSNVYFYRQAGDRKENLELSIAAFNSALAVYIEANCSFEWAVTQYNFGRNCLNCAVGDRRENLELSIAAFKAALQVYTKNVAPEKWAEIHYLLGGVYRECIRGKENENLELSIAAFESASQIYTRDVWHQKWAAVQNAMGLSYSYSSSVKNSGLAIDAFKAALEVFTEERSPHEWAAVQNNLGMAYRKRVVGHERPNTLFWSECMGLSIAAYRNALRVYAKLNLTEKWAETQSNLGIALSTQLSDNEENDELALTYFQSTLKIQTAISDPSSCLKTAYNLGNLAMRKEKWQLAIDAYLQAIDVIEQERSWANYELSRREELEYWIDVYHNVVQAFVNSAQVERAIEYVERSKARNLVDLLSTHNLYPEGEVSKTILQELDRLRQEITKKQRYFGNAQAHEHLNDTSFDRAEQYSRTTSTIATPELTSPLKQWQQELCDLRADLDVLITQKINPIDPNFSLTQKVEAIQFQQIQALLLDNKTCIIQWYVLEKTFLTFIIPYRGQPLVCQSSTEDQEALSNWANKYFKDYNENKVQWQKQLGDHLESLAQILHLGEILKEEVLQSCQQLILIPHRFLHLLPLHALPLPGEPQKCLLDRFQEGVRYAPSCQILQLIENQQQQDFERLFAVQNPTQDLRYTDMEVAAIRRGFCPHDDVLEGKQAVKESLNPKRMNQAHCAHFSCHGYFNSKFPLQSALLLADSKIDPDPNNVEPSRYLQLREEGTVDLSQCLTLSDLFDNMFDLRKCRLVTLSACETGLTELNSLSDEYVGLPSGFLYAGSSNVVSSLWAVSDLSTAFLMIKFYQNLQVQTQPTISVALNQAQLWLRNVTKEKFLDWMGDLNLEESQTEEVVRWLALSGEQPFRQPQYWAAFGAVGL